MNEEEDIIIKDMVQNSYNDPNEFVRWNDEELGVRVYELGENEFLITHRGTSLNRGNDLKADISIALGFYKSNDLFNDRLKATKTIIENIKKDNPDVKIIIGGHSLGGKTAEFSLQDEYIFNNVEHGELFSVFRPQIENDKVDYNRISGDILSTGPATKKNKIGFWPTRFGTIARAVYGHSIGFF